MATVTSSQLSLEKTLEELITEYNNLRSDVSSVTLETLITAASSVITFEGTTDDSYETTLGVVDPTADRTITLPNVTGTVVTTANAGDGATTTTFADLDQFLINDGGTLKKMALSTIAASLPALTPASANANALGSAALEWADLFLGDSSVISFGNDQDTTLTHTDGSGLTLNSTNKLMFNDASQFIQGASATVLDIAATDEIELTATLIDVVGNFTASGIIKTDDTTAATSTTDGSLQTDGGLSVVLDAVIGNDLLLLSDAAVLSFGANSEVTLTHVHNDGLLLNTDMQLQFRDSAINIRSDADGDLDINADDEIELNSTLIDINGNVEISGTLAQADTVTMATNKKIQFRDTAIHISSTADGDLSIAADDEIDITSTLIDINGNVDISGTALITGVATHGGNVISDTDSTDDLGTTGVRWRALYVDAITATDQITATGFTGTLDGILGSGAAAAATVTTLTASGVASVDDTTDTTSGTTGSIHTDGGLGVAKALYVGTTAKIIGVTTHGGNVVSDTDSTDDLGTTGVRWRALYVDAITATDQITATGFTGTLDGILGSGAAAAATTTTLASTTITASGIIKTDDATQATSTTDGSLQTDGGLSVAKDAVLGNDLIMISDAGVVKFGVNADVTLTHVHDTGILLNSTNVIQFNDASQNIGAPSATVLDINATDEIELNATLVDINANVEISGNLTVSGTTTQVNTVTMNAANAIILEGATADDYETTLTLVDPTADRTITLPNETGTVHTTGGTTTHTSIVIANTANIGSVGDTDAIAIAANGVVTFSQIPVMPANSIDSDEYIDGSIDRAHLAADIIDGTKIADDAINSEHYVDGSIDTAHIANSQITVGKMAANSVDSAQYVDDSIDTAHYAAGSVDATALGADCVTAAKIGDNVLNSEHYAAGSIDAEHLASDSVTEVKMAANSVDSQAYVDASIDTAHYAAGSVNATALGADCVTAAKIGDNVINSEHYAAASIDNEHLADGAVGGNELKTVSTLLIKNAAGGTLKTLYGAGAL